MSDSLFARRRPGGVIGRTTGSGALARTLEPVSVEEFLAEHWEREPLVVPRGEEGRFDDLLSVADVEWLVCSSGLRFPAFRLAKAGAKLDVSSYTKDLSWRPTPFTGAVDVERVLAEFEDGATIVLQGLHLNWAPLAEFCRALESELGHPAQANAYFTPRSAQGLPVHHDTHDVFSLQVAGEKRWLVYEPVWELPIKNQRYKEKMGDPGPPVHDVTLRAGDTLYLPRGWLHEAKTSAADSLHITVGVNVYTWIDALRAAVESCAADVAFRRSAGGEGAEDLLERLAERLQPDQVERRRRRKLLRTRRPILGGQLSQLRALDELDLETQVERRPTVLFDLSGATLAFEGKDVSFPDDAREELEFIAEAAEPFTPAELPGDLDDEGRLVLVRRLVREGFLLVSAAAPRSGADAAE
ncbi:MAG: cupin domain-containing protein [Gaiellaceae bacterium]